MDPTAATFTATRRELLGSAPLLGSGEIARGVVRSADVVVTVLGLTDERMRRVDGWLGRVGFVTHAAAADANRPVLGSVCGRESASILVPEIVGSLAGPLPSQPATAAVAPFVPGGLSPSTLPSGVDRIAIVSVIRVHDRAGSRQMLVAVSDGLLAAEFVGLDEPVVAEPIGSAEFLVRLGALVDGARGAGTDRRSAE